MSDCLNMLRLASTAFPALTVSGKVEGKIDHLRVPVLAHTLTIAGHGLSHEVTVTGASETEAVANAKGPVARARRAYETAAILNSLKSDWTPGAYEDARRQLLEARGVDAFRAVAEKVRAQDAANLNPVEMAPRASTAQKEEIVRLLNHPAVTRPEKTKVLLNYNRLLEEQAEKEIVRLAAAIDAYNNAR